jgi:hypothetical protein|tara:strand:- start:2883 stop:3611 length:729 start_codon:yes stop_codon:yes gene_type:complete
MFSNKKISNSNSSIDNLFSKSNNQFKSNIFVSDKNNKDLTTESFSGHVEKFNLNNLNIFKIITFIIISILLLGFIGINIFSNLGEITDYFIDFTKPVLGAFSYLTGETIKTTIDKTTGGSNTIVGGISNVSSNTLNTTEKGVNTIINTSGEYTKTGITKLQDKLLQKNNIVNTENNNDYIENSSLTDEYENTKGDKVNLKSGYCYIGSQKNKRYCAEISESSKCMSGDIYPTLDICVNPNIR